MQVGGQATEVDGEEELEGWDAILQHNHDKCMDCWWCLDMRDLGHIPIGLMFLYENKLSLKGIHMFYLHHKHVEKWVWKNVFLLDCWCRIKSLSNDAVIIAIPYNKTSHQEIIEQCSFTYVLRCIHVLAWTNVNTECVLMKSRWGKVACLGWSLWRVPGVPGCWALPSCPQAQAPPLSWGCHGCVSRPLARGPAAHPGLPSGAAASGRSRPAGPAPSPRQTPPGP